MTQFEQAILTMNDLDGKVIVVGETSSYLATMYFMPFNTGDECMYISFIKDAYDTVGSCEWNEMQEHYDEAKAEGVKIWESEDNDE